MKGIRDIKRRIKAVKSTGQITRAMQLVSAAKMKQAQEQALSNRHYSFLLYEMARSLQEHLQELKHPLLEDRPIQNRGILCISTNKGLCGALNSSLLRLINHLPRETTHFICSGKKALQSLARLQCSILAEFEIPEKPSFHSIQNLLTYMIELFLDGQIDTIEVAYSGFVNTLVQEACLEKIVPIIDLKSSIERLEKQYKIAVSELDKDDRMFHFEPSKEDILDSLPLLFVKQNIYHCFLEARAAEHSARMVAMKTATDNSKNLIQELTLEYNKARQSMITQEILEISASTLAQQK